MTQSNTTLKKSLGPTMIWGLGVGYVISGMYFGWNLGLPEGGPYGMLVALFFVTLLYIAFVLSYAELACAIPRAGGAFVYALRALGPKFGVLAGVAQYIEFVFAPPAIAAAIGAYFSIFIPGVSPLAIAVVAYVAFTFLNIYGVKQTAIFEFWITVFAVLELLIFSGVTLPHFSFESFSQNPFPSGVSGIFASIPYAIWFYLAIEGIANIAEEAINPKRDLVRGFMLAMGTLVVLAVLVFFAAIGVAGWEAIVYTPGTQTASDSPLPLAMAQVMSSNHFLYHSLIAIGLFGLVASFNGIILVAGRAVFEMGREGFAPKYLGKTLPGRQTPALALLTNFAVGIIALLSGKTGEIITISVFGALTLYAVAMISLLVLRKKEPKLSRPYVAPWYPFVPILALILSLVCLIALATYNPKIALVYLGLIVLGSLLGLWSRGMSDEKNRRRTS